MGNFEELKERIYAFTEARNWDQFHNPKDLSMSIVIEAVELMEHFQWKTPEEIEAMSEEERADVEREVADVQNYLILFARKMGINIVDATISKLDESERKYPIDKAKDSHKKYTEHQS